MVARARERPRAVLEDRLSRSILQEAAHATFVAPLRGVGWSDWGRLERVLKSLQRASSAPTASISSALIV
jgi:hypothetical protein